ncbi:Protein kinase DC2 [Tetrabaena socialis]|uniref:Protein kinase DC2 n=1 Tax=Tetrabaena socialis TaxID=47790 RepID=A0A2J8AC54_9CHLO|nr:Protein kinase DC2 [Tetrabaena socialis]|eukprot:PNH10104.1 Protein kinase DC2 [Tetrabaena socialis]
MESTCSTSSSSPTAKQPAKDAGKTGGWKHTVVTELRRKLQHAEVSDVAAKVQIIASAEGPLPVPKVRAPVRPLHRAEAATRAPPTGPWALASMAGIAASQRLDSTSSSASSATTPASPARTRPPCKSDYAWVRVIGAGSFGRVSLARHIQSGKLVAIKTLSKAAIIRENQVQHVVDERAMLARVSGYPFVINLLATFQGHNTEVDWWSLGCVLYEMLHGFPPFYTGNPHETYRRILQHDLAFPPHIGPWAKDLINRLLNPDPTKRLGCGVDGVQGIKDHDWFRNLEWGYIAAKAYMPPYVPPLKAPDDTSNFDLYDNLPPLEPATGLSQMQQDWFRSFSIPVA